MKTPQYKPSIVFAFLLTLLSACNAEVGNGPAPSPDSAPEASAEGSVIDPQSAATSETYRESVDKNVFQLSWQMKSTADFVAQIDLCENIEGEGLVCDPFYEIRKTGSVELYDVYLTQDGVLKTLRREAYDFESEELPLESGTIMSYTLADEYYAGDIKAIFRLKIISGGSESAYVYMNQ